MWKADGVVQLSDELELKVIILYKSHQLLTLGACAKVTLGVFHGKNRHSQDLSTRTSTLAVCTRPGLIFLFRSVVLLRCEKFGQGTKLEQAKHYYGLQCNSWILIKCFRSRVMHDWLTLTAVLDLSEN